MPPVAKDKVAPKDPSKKKTKSRNGCGRCKLKRLKCDETSPSCLQCKKRNVACPGYEKTLKWSTKYEVLQPLQLEPPKIGSNIISRPPTATETTLPPDVVSGFEALAAVLPIGNKKPESSQEVATPSDAQQVTTDAPIPSAHASTSPELYTSPHSIESTVAELDDISNALLHDGLQESIELPNDELSFDSLHHLDHLDNFNYSEPTWNDEDVDVEEIQRPSSQGNSVASASPRSSRSLLLDYYRIPSPSSSYSLGDMDSLLVQHYFKDVCVLFSSFDSILNPFRTTISRIFQDSSSVYYAIQSMAAAHLANAFPNMTSVGIEMQRKACESLQMELPLVQSGQASGTKSFLSIILLGITTSWHESSALGEDFLATARSLILPKLLCASEREEVQRETKFFEESLIYWEMLMGFVTQDAVTFSQGSVTRSRAAPATAAAVARNKEGKIVPHPWTGIAPTIQLLFAEVGRLVRSERMSILNHAIDRRRAHDNLLNAASLESDLLAAEYPMADELADPGDEWTSKRDFIVIAEAYRCAGLLELYRVFPSLLRKRLGTDKFTWTDQVEFEFPTPRFETPYEDTDTKLWLNSLASHILTTLETLPSSTGTCCLQPILLLVAGSELTFVSSVDYFDMYANDAKVLQSREFALGRLQEYALRLPAKPIRKSIEILKEVWRRVDGGLEGGDVFWIDVMVEKGWHTIMG